MGWFFFIVKHTGELSAVLSSINDRYFSGWRFVLEFYFWAVNARMSVAEYFAFLKWNSSQIIFCTPKKTRNAKNKNRTHNHTKFYPEYSLHWNGRANKLYVACVARTRLATNNKTQMSALTRFFGRNKTNRNIYTNTQRVRERERLLHKNKEKTRANEKKMK